MILPTRSMAFGPMLLFWLLLFPAAAAAHTLFLKPDALPPGPANDLTIVLRNGTFWESEAVLRQERLADLTLIDPEGRATEVGFESWRVVGKDAMVQARLDDEGTYVVGAATRPSVARLAAEDFNRYLRNEGLTEQLGSRDELGESATAVSERYTKFAKTIVQVGPAATDAFQVSLDHKVEIVPLVNPASLQVGDTFKARVYFDGKPLGGERVFVSSASAQPGPLQDGPLEALELISAEDGGIAFTVTEPGLWYVRFIRLERLGDSEYWYSDLLAWLGLQEARVPYQSFWATLTFRIP